MSENKQPKTRLELAIAKRERLLKEAEEAKRNIKLLEAKVSRVEADEKRNREKHLKAHVGGMVEMTGLMRYVYPDGVEKDNPQDSLIANLLVGMFLSVSQMLESSTTDELEKYWNKGRDYRAKNKLDRLLPKVNPNLGSLFDKLGIVKSATNQQPNDNVQSAETVV